MKRGELYRVFKGAARDPKRSRVFVIVSRPLLLEVPFPTVICAPVFSSRHGHSTQVNVGVDEGLKHDSAVHCDELASIPKSALTNYVGSLSQPKVEELRAALIAALALD